jgi:DNA-binding transcriptional regulator GbsR (MarR family)
MDLPPLTQAFVLHFGEMGRNWGINRSVGQVYALLFAADRPLHAEAISDALGISRSNVSMAIKELQGWRLVRLVHIPDDRRDHFETPADLWEIFRTLAEERRRREVEPTLSTLRDLLLQTATSDAERHAQARMQALHDLIELLLRWHDDVAKLPTERLVALLELGARIGRVLDFKDRLFALPGGQTRGNKTAAPT